jgi:hypothetical protein
MHDYMSIFLDLIRRIAVVLIFHTRADAKSGLCLGSISQLRIVILHCVQNLKNSTWHSSHYFRFFTAFRMTPPSWRAGTDFASAMLFTLC